MEALRTYLNTLGTQAQLDFAARCQTSVGYLRKAISAGQKLGESIVIAIERESAGAVKCEQIRPDVDWAYIRGTGKRKRA